MPEREAVEALFVQGFCLPEARLPTYLCLPCINDMRHYLGADPRVECISKGSEEECLHCGVWLTGMEDKQGENKWKNG